jgi:hypothetical protein
MHEEYLRIYDYVSYPKREQVLSQKTETIPKAAMARL